MKKLGIVVLVLLAVVAILLVVVVTRLGDVIKNAVETVGPGFTGGEVTLADVSVKPLKGEAGLRGFVVGNPEGYKTDKAFELGEVQVKVDLGSVTKDTIIINEIVIDGPEITYEKSLKKSNIAQILDNVNKAAGVEEGGEEPEEEPAEKGEGKKVVIDHVIVKNARVRLSTALLMGKAVSIPLPTIELEDIGKESEGTTFAEATSEILKAVLGSVTEAVSKSVELAGDAAKAVGDAAIKGADAALKGAGAAADAAAKGAGAATDAAMKGAGAAADAATKGAGAAVDVAADAGKAVGDGAAKAGKAVGKGATKVVKGIGGLFGKGDDAGNEEVKEEVKKEEFVD
ncbi:MAG: hypothetical protein QGH15_16835 [Kiritimatiellia bacterium]|nr:hypothetical protein [Kiritimatiellia bacterium]